MPIVFVVENNEYAISTHVSESISVPEISTRAKGFGLPGVTVDGRDIYTVYEAASEAIDRARNGNGSTLLEAKTVRWSRHSAIAAGGSGEHADRWKETDPIPRYQKKLIELGIVTEERVEEIEAKAKQEIDQAIEFAINSPYPAAEEIYTDVFSEVGGEDEDL